ncbi:S26 family signal peptidase [Streptomyces sp. ME01-24h]|nr:S26 family signal peptidase [Streptomyces sp. ME01-24h]
MTYAPLIGTVAVAVLSCVRAVARRLLVVVTVSGDSMSPALVDGDVLLVLRRGLQARRGRVVVVDRPDPRTGWRWAAAPRAEQGKQWYVKRVAAAGGDPVPAWAAGCPERSVPPGMLVLLGDHPGSEDSKRWGYCPVGCHEGPFWCACAAPVPG